MRETRQPVFIAATAGDAETIEKLLDVEGIEYDLRPETFARPLPGATCYQGLLFEVYAEEAEYCRRLLRERGFGEGVVE